LLRAGLIHGKLLKNLLKGLLADIAAELPRKVSRVKNQVTREKSMKRLKTLPSAPQVSGFPNWWKMIYQ
jgi:hypothetical protein